MKLINSYRDFRKAGRVVIPAILVGTTLIAAGCASLPAPTEQIAVSKVAVKSAISSGGNEFAPLETKSAIEKMNDAERAMAEKDYVNARRLAEQRSLTPNLPRLRLIMAKLRRPSIIQKNLIVSCGRD